MSRTHDWRPTRARARELVREGDAFWRARVPFLRDRPPLAESEIEDRLAEASARNAFWRDRTSARPIDEALAGATMAQVIVYAVPYSHEDICNGGFHQYFHNPTGDLAEVTVAGLRTIGEDARADLFVRAMAELATGVSPPDRDQRIALLDDVETWRQRFHPIEDAYYALDRDALYARVRAYADAHPSELFLDS